MVKFLRLLNDSTLNQKIILSVLKAIKPLGLKSYPRDEYLHSRTYLDIMESKLRKLTISNYNLNKLIDNYKKKTWVKEKILNFDQLIIILFITAILLAIILVNLS